MLPTSHYDEAKADRAVTFMTFSISCKLPDTPMWSVESVAAPRNI